jgi:hypothetical protein
MPLIRCTSCAYANAMDAKVCKKCGQELSVPPHLIRCAHCGTLNPVKGTACVWCFRKLGGSWRRRLLGRPARGAAVVLLAVLGYYAYPRGLLREAPRPPVAAPIVPAAPAPEPAAKPQAGTQAPRVDRQPGETPRAKAAPARQASARKAGEPTEGSDCAEGVAALGLCGKTKAAQPPRTQACTEAVAALGLCDARNTQGRE